MSALRIHEIRNIQHLAALEAEWWDLWRRCPAVTVFQSPGWLLPWWRAFAPGDLRVIAVRRAGRLVGLAPLYLEDGERARRLLPLGIGLSDYVDILIDEEFTGLVAQAFVDRLHMSYDWDAIELTELAPGAAALKLNTCRDWIERRDRASACPILGLPASMECLCQVIPARRRQTLGTARNRAARRPAMEIASHRTANPQELLESLIQLHTARWNSKGERGVFADERLHRFHHDAVQRLTDAGLLRLYALRFGADTAGVYYGFLERGRAYFYLLGFDPAFAFESPGAILIGHAIEEAVREGAREFHFLRGQESYKYEWGAVDRWNTRRTFHRLSAFAAAS